VTSGAARWLPAFLGVAFIVATPLLVTDRYVLHVLNVSMIFAILAIGQNIITGWCGMLTLGHAAFFGVGAYTSALLALDHGWPFLACFAAAGAMAGLAGFLLAIPCLRVRSDFLSLITIAFAQMFFVVVNNWTELTRGPMGLPRVPRVELFGWIARTEADLFWVLGGALSITMFLVHRLVAGPIGRAWEAVRDDEAAARALGVNVAHAKVQAFTIGCVLAGFAGSLYAHSLRIVAPEMFLLEESLIVMQMAILGGLASLPGSLLGAALMVGIPEALRSTNEWLITLRPGIGGVILMVMMVWRPQGLLGRLRAAPPLVAQLSALLRGALGRR
jgi:branched-chain amino acid transport system permease protein